MHDHYASVPVVVVGIDGSRSAVDAALWAVDEAVSRDIPLRLVSPSIPADHRERRSCRCCASNLATAESRCQAGIHGGRVDRQARQDRSRDPAEEPNARVDRVLTVRPRCCASAPSV